MAMPEKDQMRPVLVQRAERLAATVGRVVDRVQQEGLLQEVALAALLLALADEAWEREALALVE